MKRIIIILTVLLAGFAAKTQNWPSYSGPHYNFMGDTSDNVTICTHENYVTKKWESADTFGLGRGRSQAQRYGCSNLQKTPSTHCASPIVYDGKMYLYYLEPVGPHYDQSVVDALIYNSGCDSAEVYERLDLWYIEAKDHILCLDAETGEQLWRTSFDGFYSAIWDKPRGSNNTCCAANGKIYHYTSMGKVFCLDANTGNVVWETPNLSWKEDERSQAIIDSEFDDGGSYSADALKGSPMIYAGGAVLYAVSGTIRAYDASNGTKLWEQSNAISKQATPSVWTHESDTFVVAANFDGDLYCYDPKTGTIQWEEHGLGNNRKGLTISDNYLMCIADSGNNKYGHDGKLGVYSLTPDSAELLWIHHDDLTSGYNPPGVIVNDRAYRLIRSRNQIYEFDIQTGEVLNKVGAIVSGGFMSYINGKIIYDTDSHHASKNSFIVFEANADTLYKLFGWTPSEHFNYTNAYEWSMAFPIVDGNMFIRSSHRIYCYDWTKKEKHLHMVKFSHNEFSLLTGNTTSFDISITDQYGVEYHAEVTKEWTVQGAGSIDASGTYTAPSFGGIVDTVVITVSEPGTEVKDTAYVTVKQTQHISCPQLDSVYYLQEPFRLACNASSGLPVVYEEVSGPFNLSGDTVNLLGVPGTAYISVTQPGNDVYDAASSVMYTFIISYTEPDDAIPEVSVEEVQDNKVDVYPNPTKGYIKFSSTAEHVQVYSILGEEILDKNNVNRIDISSQPDGLYLMKIGDHVIKVIKK